MGTPSWPNHAQICADLGLAMKSFSHAAADGSADMDALRAAIAEAQEGDCFLLHGCCHNPTGIDYSNADWDEIAGLIAAKKLLPLLDLAYQGLGAGMEEDAYGVRRVLAAVPEAIVAYSCDKNFGLYRDRTGALYVMMAEPGQLQGGDVERPCPGPRQLVTAARSRRSGGADRAWKTQRSPRSGSMNWTRCAPACARCASGWRRRARSAGSI